jgi:IrrE N-terminal-like domain
VASGDGSDQDLEPERRLGRLLVERLDLHPPVNIHQVATSYADVEVDSIPGDCDALVVGLAGDRPRPLIVLKSSRPWRRERFSLAHELGHVLIPWHVGLSSVCYLERGETFGAWEYRRDEAQANRFASEVLVPARWLSRVVDAADALPEIFTELERANVSAPAGCLALIRFLPPGYILVLPAGGLVDYAARSEGTVASLPRRGHPLNATTLSRFAESHDTATFAGRAVAWWFFGAEVKAGLSDDPRTSHEIIDEILAERIDPQPRPKVRQSVFAVAGHAKGAYGASGPAELHGRLRERYASHPELGEVTSHPDFDLFCLRRAEELLGS